MTPQDRFRATGKPAGSPLWKHQTGYWAKKHNGQTLYFGPRWGTPDEAMVDYRRFQDDPGKYLMPGADPVGGPTVETVCNAFATAKLKACKRGDIQPVTFNDYKETASFVADTLGREKLVAELRPPHFDDLLTSAAGRWGPVRRGNFVTRTRMIFTYAHDCDLINTVPKYGPEFKKPSRAVVRRSRTTKKTFTPRQIRTLLDAARETRGPLPAMILLGINGAMGNADVGTLEIADVNFKRKVIDYTRHKTGIARVVPLWPETLSALRDWLDVRPAPRDAEHDRLVFLTMFGVPWHRPALNGHAVKRDFPLSQEFAKLLKRCNMRRTGVGFYGFRHTFETIASATNDYAAVDRVMGHEIKGASRKEYLREIELARLRKVVNHVRAKVLK